MNPRDVKPTKTQEKRPWGVFETFVRNEPCSIKILTVEAGEQLSLQKHRLRSEWWIVLDGEMDVEINGSRSTLKPGDEAFIPVGALHRIYGLDQPCRWLEIAFGHFDEDDIERFEDAYGRATP